MEYGPGTLALGLLAITLSGPALAESRPIATTPPDWSGLYVGASIATPRGDNNWRVVTRGEHDLVPGGWNGSAPSLTFGRDWQSDRLVYGASLSIGGGQLVAWPTSAFFFTCVECQTVVSDVATLRARAGVTAGNSLFFATVGLARANTKAANVGGEVGYAEETMNGWSAGLGVEHRIGDHLSVSVAYERFGLGALDLSAYYPDAVSEIRFGLMQVGMNVRW